MEIRAISNLQSLISKMDEQVLKEIWEPRFQSFLETQDGQDAAHTIDHILRVVANVRRLTEVEAADMAVVIPAAWLHDCVTVPKSSPNRHLASRMAAEAAGEFLREQAYPDEYIAGIQHAIAAHSFSAQIPPETLEAKVVQDADRLDSIGAIGIARCLMLSAEMKRPLYNTIEPFPTTRPPNDLTSAVDHFYTKLFKLEGMMQTHAGKQEAQKRTRFMRDYLAQLGQEIGGD